MPFIYQFSMELRHLRYFKVVGTEEHFVRAAKLLNVTQPALSRQIQDLERELGFSLFERLPRGVRLSSAGKFFLEDASNLLADLDYIVGRARGFADGRLGTVRIGFNELASGDDHIPLRLLDFRKREPAITLTLMPMASIDQITELKSSRLDVAIVYGVDYDPADLDILNAIQVGSNDIVLAIHSEHPLANKPALRLADLAGEPMLWSRRRGTSDYYDTLMRRCLDGGLSPNIVQEVATPSILISMVSVGMGLGLIHSSVSTKESNRVILREIEDLKLSFPVHLLWRKSDPSPAVARLVEVFLGQQQDGC